MSKDWKEVEKTVETLHKLMLGTECEIKANDRIKDKITGQPREVDVSIRLKSGYIPILIVVECRDRDVEDVTWIEQLVTKREKIGANKLIAVSSTGFTKPAIITAEHYGIITQVLSKITSDDVNSWLHGNSVGTARSFYRFINVNLRFVDDEHTYIMNTVEDKIFSFENKNYSFNDIFRMEILDKEHNFFDDVGLDGSKTIKKIDIPIPNKYSFNADNLETYYVECFTIEMELWKEYKSVPFSKMFCLGEGDNKVIEWAGTDPIDLGNGPVKLSVSRKKDSDVLNIGFDILD